MHISLESIFRDATQLQDEIHKEQELRKKLYGLLVIAVACSGLYGLVMGLHHSLAQALSSAVKVPLLFMATLTICLPTLHFVGLLFGSRVRFLQSLVVLLWGIAVMAVLLGAFAPVALFFSMSQPQYEFILLLHVGIFAFCGTASLLIIKRNMKALTAGEATTRTTQTTTLAPAVSLYSIPKSPNKPLPEPAQTIHELYGNSETQNSSEEEPPHEPNEARQAAHKPASEQATDIAAPAQEPPAQDRPASQPETSPTPPLFLSIWMCLYMFVGAQMAYILSPFIGRNEGFVILNTEQGNFFQAVFRAFFKLLQ